MNNMTTIMESWRKNSAEFDNGLLSEEYNKLIQKNSELADAAFVEAVFGIKPIIAESGGFDVATQRLILEQNKDLQDDLEEGVVSTAIGGASMLKSVYQIAKLTLNPQSNVDIGEAVGAYVHIVSRKLRKLGTKFIWSPLAKIKDFFVQGLGQKLPDVVRQMATTTLDFVKEKTVKMFRFLFLNGSDIKRFTTSTAIGFGMTFLMNQIKDKYDKIFKIIDKISDAIEVGRVLKDTDFGDLDDVLSSMKKLVSIAWNRSKEAADDEITSAIKKMDIWLKAGIEVAEAIVDFFKEPLEDLASGLSIRA